MTTPNSNASISDFMDELSKEAEEAPDTRSPATLADVQAMAATAVSYRNEISVLEEKLKALKTKEYELLHKELPAAMSETRTKSLNHDGYELKCEPYVKANIAADDSEEQRDQAFKWLEENGGAEIIKNVVSVVFPKDNAEDARLFFEETQKRFDNQRSILVKNEKSTPWGTLTKWLKEYIQTPPKAGEIKSPVPVDILNATIGMIVRIKKERDV